MENISLSLLLKLTSTKFKQYLDLLSSNILLTTSQVDIIAFLLRHKSSEINPIDIEKHFKISRATTIGLLNRLKEKDFIYFKESNKDKRYKQIVLCDKAYKLEKDLTNNIKKAEKVLYKDINPDDLEITKKTIIKMYNNLTYNEVNNDK